jgi:DNA polymerase
MKTLGIDIETFSGSKLTDCGVYRYCEDPDFTILLIGYSVDGGEVSVIDLTDPDNGNQENLEEFKRMLFNPDIVKTAYNANFERTCLGHYFGQYCKPEEWDDTMIRAAYLGFPRSLDAVGSAVGLPEDKKKLKTGKDLIRYFCQPCRKTKSNGGRTRNTRETDPEKWNLFIEYNRRDVETEQAIRQKLSYCKIPVEEHELWCLDQHINDRGVRLDMQMANTIVRKDDEYQKMIRQKAKDLTGLANPKSNVQLMGWIRDKGFPAESLDKQHVADYLQECRDPEILEALRLKQKMSKTSTSKYKKMQVMACSDDRARGCFQFYGARSGRWAGRGLQLQNLPQNHIPDLDNARELAKAGDTELIDMEYGSVPDVYSQLVRTTFIPSEGNTFVVSDFSAIEARVLAWLAGEEWVLQAFRDGKDIYCATASQMFGVPVVKHGINGELRQKGKVATLACGYRGGIGAFRKMGGDRLGMSEEEMQDTVNIWRSTHPKTVKLWKNVMAAAVKAIQTNRSQTIPLANGKSSLRFDYKAVDKDISFLSIKLPSGRRLFYVDPRVEDSSKGRQIIFKGQNQMTRKWEDVEIYDGKVIENITQAFARDCLGVTMQRVTDAGYQIVMHVHDEMIIDCPREDTDALEKVNTIMAEPIPWAPGLPLKGDGYVTDYYKKD